MATSLKNNQPFSISCFAFLRCRRFISDCAALTIKPATLSPSAFRVSIASKSSSGNLTEICIDLLFLRPVAIAASPYVWWCSVYTKKSKPKRLKWCSPECKVVFTKARDRPVNSNAPECGNTAEAFNHNVIETYAMTNKNHTTLPPVAYCWLFLAVSRSDTSARPHRESITAPDEHAARKLLAGQFVLSFAGRLPVQGGNHA